MNATDLDAYFARIGYGGSAAPTLDTLAALHRLQPAAIAFENLDPLCGRPVPLDEAALLDKMVRRRRGGYCFEQNGLFGAVLAALGFAVEFLPARVLWKRPPGWSGPRTHEALRVRLAEGDFLADVGFGRLTMTAPLRFGTATAQDTPHERYRLQPAQDGSWVVEASSEGTWMPLFQLFDEVQSQAGREAVNRFTATSPDSVFTGHLMAARVDDDRRLGLFDRDFSCHLRGRAPDRQRLDGVDALAARLSDAFGIDVPATAMATLGRIAAEG